MADHARRLDHGEHFRQASEHALGAEHLGELVGRFHPVEEGQHDRPAPEQGLHRVRGFDHLPALDGDDHAIDLAQLERVARDARALQVQVAERAEPRTHTPHMPP